MPGRGGRCSACSSHWPPQRFDFGLSARWGDPRDHLLLLLAGAKTRLGFPRLGSGIILTQPLARPEPQAHRYEYWRVMAQVLGFDMPAREALALPHSHPDGEILVHTGAGQPVRVWPLERYRTLVARLRRKGYRVQVACDPGPADLVAAGGGKGRGDAADGHGVVRVGGSCGRVHWQRFRAGPPGRVLRRAHLHAVWPANARVVCPAPSGVGVARRQSLPVQALFGLLPVPSPVLHGQFAARKKCVRWWSHLWREPCRAGSVVACSQSRAGVACPVRSR